MDIHIKGSVFFAQLQLATWLKYIYIYGYRTLILFFPHQNGLTKFLFLYSLQSYTSFPGNSQDLNGYGKNLLNYWLLTLLQRWESQRDGCSFLHFYSNVKNSGSDKWNPFCHSFSCQDKPGMGSCWISRTHQLVTWLVLHAEQLARWSFSFISHNAFGMTSCLVLWGPFEKRASLNYF